MKTADRKDKLIAILLRTRHQPEAVSEYSKGHICRGTPVVFDYEYLFSEIEAFAEECVQEDRATRTADDLYRWSREGGRNQGLEEAAKISETIYGTRFHNDIERRTGKKIALNIRALKSK